MAAPEELQYTQEHEWVLIDGDIATVGVTAYAAGKLGDVVFVELPPVGTEAAAARVIGEIESTKSVGEIFAPLTGTVTEVNDAVVERPELVNSDPFGEGWLLKLAVTGPVDGLLSYAAYTALTGE